MEDNKAHIFPFSQAFNNDKSKTPIIFFLEFSAVPLRPINTNSYPKLCVVHTLLNRFATNLLNVPEKKIHSAEFSLKAPLADCDVCLILLSFQRIQYNFSTAAIAKLFTDYIL